MRTLHPSSSGIPIAFFFLTAAADHSTHSEKMESGMIANAATTPTLLKPQSVHSVTHSLTLPLRKRKAD